MFFYLCRKTPVVRWASSRLWSSTWTLLAWKGSCDGERTKGERRKKKQVSRLEKERENGVKSHHKEEEKAAKQE